MQAEKLQLKLFARPGTSVDSHELVPVFHRFIREHALDELLIDVADYGHVKGGPGVVLVGDANDYYLDQGEGRLGLLFSRKRHGSGPEGRVREALARLFRAARLLEEAPELGGRLRFATDELLVRVPDRLRATNDEAGFGTLVKDVTPWLERAFGAGSLQIERGAAAPAPLEARVRVGTSKELAALSQALGG